MIPVTSQTVVSNVFRLASWVHLRSVPLYTRSPVALLTLYGTFLVLWYHEGMPEESPVPVKVVDLKDDEKTNGHAVGAPVNGVVIGRARPDPVPTPLRLMFSLPSKSPWIKLFHLLVNTLIFVFTISATYYLHSSFWNPSDLTFARVGATYSDAVKIQVRYPDLHDPSLPRSDVGTLKVLWREAISTASGAPETVGGMWKDGPVLQLSEENDWVGVAHLTKLWPGYSYQFRLAYPNSTFLPHPSEPLPFKTFPDPRLRSGNRYNFIVSSGTRLNFPYNPFASPNHIRGLDLLYRRLFPKQPRPHQQKKQPIAESDALPAAPVPAPVAAPVPEDVQFVTQPAAGDAPDPLPPAEPSAVSRTVEQAKQTSRSLFDRLGNVLETVLPESSTTPKPAPPAFLFLLGDILPQSATPPYKTADIDSFKMFRTLYSSLSFRRLYEVIPVFHISGPTQALDEVSGADRPESAATAFDTYSSSANYPGYARGSYFDFMHGDSAFFVLDTSTHRSESDAPEFEKTLLGGRQFTDLVAWAGKHNATAVFKFIISPVPLSSMWGPTSKSETWADYPEERARLVDLLSYVPNMVVISGGRNEFAAIEYSVGNKFSEFVTGPMNGHSPWGWDQSPKEARNAVRTIVKNLTVTLPVEGFGWTGEPVNITDIENIQEERLLKNIRRGNHRWSTFFVDTTTEPPKLVVEVFTDSQPEWSHTIVGKAVVTKRSSAVGMVLTGGLKSVLEKLGFGWLTGQV